MSEAHEELCPKRIMKVPYNALLKLIAVNTRNGMSSRALYKCIKLPDKENGPNVCPGILVARVEWLEQRTVVELSFDGIKSPEYLLLGDVRHPVAHFRDRPLQCINCYESGSPNGHV